MSKDSNENWRGKVGKMSEVEINDFFAEGPICRLGCLDKDGWPYIAPCWFEYKDGGFFGWHQDDGGNIDIDKVTRKVAGDYITRKIKNKNLV